MITLAHGAGGRLSHQLIEEHFLPRLGNQSLNALLDSAVIGELAITTDSHVVTPRFFPGGDLGSLAICGTVNDLAAVGAEPIGLTAGFILEEGLPLSELDRIVESMALAAREAGVDVVAGDTKVVGKGACDGMFITTSGVGRLAPGFMPAPDRIEEGDVVITSGTLGDHGMAVMTCREGLRVEGDLKSDVAPLAGLVRCVREAGIKVHAMRDPTRGGIAQSLIELSMGANALITIEERLLPCRRQVRAACELLGIDLLYVANEGKLVVLMPEDQVDRALEVMRAHPLGRRASVIGRVEKGAPGLVLETAIGSRRPVRMPLGELLPRIC